MERMDKNSLMHNERCWDLLFFDTRPVAEPEKDALEQDSLKEGDEAICCAHCKSHVTSIRQQLVLSGAFEHRFSNPAGVVFNIGCFSKAPGCKVDGLPTLEYTWFTGYRWCYALCRECMTHLGWHYAGVDGEFYGLILDRLKFMK